MTTNTAHASAPGTPEDPQPGTRIDDFTIAYRISRGMNADVFAVWHHELRAPLVCKRLRFADEHYAKWRRLLRTESAALARMNHPGIVRLINQNMRARLPYLLLEHIGGQTLRKELNEQGNLATDAAVRIVQHTGAALIHAHARGFVHRDLKPSNIILRGDGRPVLLDFGVAWKWQTGRRPPDRSGTPQYLAPEQIRREPLTRATDVYGLGLLLFELITGTRAFRAGKAVRHDRRATLAARYPQLIEAPPLNLLRVKKTPRKLAIVIARCLAFEPRDRYANVAGLLTALDPFTKIKVWPQEAARRQKDFAPFE